jgi:rifampicin phosphotransferase
MDATDLTLPFDRIDATDLPRVGGKGANLGALTRAGIPVPPGFCVTTAAFDRFLAGLPDADARFTALAAVSGADAGEARAAAEAMRAALDGLAVPPEVAAAVVAAWRVLGTAHSLAVRSSATAEDLPGASFAGQQDTYLNIQGEAALLDAVRRCWISLFTDRAVLYRARGGFDHRAVRLSVVVQRLVDPEVSGILFTADPVSGHRGVVAIDAGWGLGEALVSGLVSADLYRVDRKRRAILEATAGDKAFAIRSVPGGGTRQEALVDPLRHGRVLDDAQVLALADLGGRIEKHYGGVPQDVEWCIAGGEINVVQARPITSLFPIPGASGAAHEGDSGLRIYLSFGHLQMMTDAMPRLAREVWGYFFPAGKAPSKGPDDPASPSRVLVDAGSRLFIDATEVLRIPRVRSALVGFLGVMYEALGRSVAALAARPELGRGDTSLGSVAAGAARILGPVLGRVPWVLLCADPDAGAAWVDRTLEAIPARARARIEGAGTPAERIRQCAREINAIFTEVRPPLARMVAGVLAHRVLLRFAQGRWADGVRGDVDALLRGLPGNVTTAMDLAVGDLADLVRPHPELAALLARGPWAEVRAQLEGVAGGAAFATAFAAFLARYGDRGSGEIDVSRPRFRDEPALLFRVITGGLSATRAAGEHRRQRAAQVAVGEAAQQRLVEAAGHGAAGPLRGWWVSRLCRVARAGMGLREHPKFMIVRILGAVRAEVLAAGATLLERGQIASSAHVWHLGFDELAAALLDPSRDLRAELSARDEVFRRDAPRTPPIVISSEGETPTLTIDRADLPPGALAGTAASSGVVEGVARVLRDPDREVLQAGEILVAPFTDPGWTPLFIHAAAVVTEVGGLMTHGAVIAREYGIPAVVSVAGATERIRTGQRIRVDGTRGFVQILDEM